MRFMTACCRKQASLKRFKFVTYIIACLFLILLFYGQESKYNNFVRKTLYNNFVRNSFNVDYVLSDEKNPDTHADIVDSYFNRRMDWPTSNLGTFLFKNIPLNTMPLTYIQKNKTYEVLIWKYWNWLKNRHVYNFGKTKVDPLQECSVKNCKFTGDDKTISSVDAVIVHVQYGVFPNATLKNPKQRWVFLNDESPKHSFAIPKKKYPKLADISNMFNWSMTYRSDSDVPVPYGRTMPLKTPILSYITEESLSSLVPYWNDKRTGVIVSILISDCGKARRNDYLKKLQKHLTIDIFGKCSKDKKKSCPGHFRSDCKVISKYLFYLAFENSECDEYLTEKLFYNAYSKGAVPVIMGPTVNRCKMLLPPDSFLHIDEYDSPEKLAKHIVEIGKNSSKLLALHRWRNHFYVANEHGYFGTKSYHLCRICEALNYNDQKVKYYDEESLRNFFDSTLSCR